MTDLSSFPIELLNGLSEPKLNYFKDITVPHRNLKILLNELFTNILEPSDAKVFFVFGVTGVGKTTLKQRLSKVLLEKFLDDLLKNPGQIAVAGMEAPSPEGGKFSYKDYYYRVLNALQEILINYKHNYGIYETDNNVIELPHNSQHISALALRRAMESCFSHRKLKAFMVDEAQHLFALSGAKQMLLQMNWIKSIANLTGTVHVLFGTYELLNCSTVNGQVGRRSLDFHLARYIKEFPEDFAEFTKVVQTFGHHLPLLKEPLLDKHCEYLIDYSIGCVGILNIWLFRSLKIALEDDTKTLTLKHLKLAELSPSRRKQIHQEVEAGERRLAELGQDDHQLLATKPPSTQLTRRRRVGERKPHRDPVGVEPV